MCPRHPSLAKIDGSMLQVLFSIDSKSSHARIFLCIPYHTDEEKSSSKIGYEHCQTSSNLTVSLRFHLS